MPNPEPTGNDAPATGASVSTLTGDYATREEAEAAITPGTRIREHRDGSFSVIPDASSTPVGGSIELGSVPESKAEPIRVEVDIPAVSMSVRRPYWVGLVDRDPMPFHSISDPGISFPRVTYERTASGDGTTEKRGAIAFLTDDEVERVKANISKLMVRRFGSDHRVLSVEAIGTKRYRHDPNLDEPLGAFLFMYPLDPDAPHNRPTTNPQPMWRKAG